MGAFVELKTQGTKTFVALTDKAMPKILGLEKKISLHRFAFVKQYKSNQVFYDTPTGLLSKAGIILSKTISPDKTYFCVEGQTALFKNFSRKKHRVFIHEVGPKDTVKDHAFYLVDGIKGLFTTQFTIDLENVLKNVKPKIIVDSVNDEYMVLSGGGFQGKITYQQSQINNFETKRKRKKDDRYKTIHVEAESIKGQLPAFNYLIDQIIKYDKDVIETDETDFDYFLRVTKPLPPKKKLSKEEKIQLKQKLKKADETIQG